MSDQNAQIDALVRTMRKRLNIDVTRCWIGDGNGRVTEGAPRGKIWVRPQSGDRPAYLVSKGVATYIPANNVPVIVGLNRAGEEAILEVDEQGVTANNIDPGIFNPLSYQYQWLYLRNATLLLTSPTEIPSLSVYTQPALFRDREYDLLRFAGQATDLTALVPSNTNAKVLVTLFYRTDGSIEAKASSEIDQSLDFSVETHLQECQSSATPLAIPVSCWVLKTGQTQITWADWWGVDPRQWLQHGLPKDNVSAVAAPTTGDDSGDQYVTLSRWLYNNEVWWCIDNTASSAVWIRHPRKFTASSAPTTSDDDTAGYIPGDFIFDTANEKLYACLSNATGAAVWKDATAGGAPADATYIVQTASSGLSNEQALAALATGILKSTTATGVVSIAAGSDIDSTHGSQTANYVYAAPDGSGGNPAFRALVDDDIPGALTIDGGTIDNSVIGGSTPAAITGTDIVGDTLAIDTDLLTASSSSVDIAGGFTVRSPNNPAAEFTRVENGSAGANFSMIKETNGIDTGDSIGNFLYYAKDTTAGTEDEVARLIIDLTDGAAGSEDARFIVRLMQNGATPSARLILNSAGDLSITGALSKGSGSFTIDHPLDPLNRILQHSFVEAPEPLLLYRGKVQLENGQAVGDLDEICGMAPGTFAALTTNTQIQVWNNSTWDAVRGTIDGATITIECQDKKANHVVEWCVYASRNDPTWKASSLSDDEGKLVIEYDKPPATYDGIESMHADKDREINLTIQQGILRNPEAYPNVDQPEIYSDSMFDNLPFKVPYSALPKHVKDNLKLVRRAYAGGSPPDEQ